MSRAQPYDNRAVRSVVHVRCGSEFGTAFLIDPSGSFLTALHVVQNNIVSNAPIELSWKGGRAQATLGSRADDRDVALLKVVLPKDHGLRPAPLTTDLKIELYDDIATFQTLDPQLGFVAPIHVDRHAIGVTAVTYEVVGESRIFDGVWSRGNLALPHGASGAPLSVRRWQAVAAVGVAGADDQQQGFFVPLGTVSPEGTSGDLHRAILRSASQTTRLGLRPNERGARVASWLAMRVSANSLAQAEVYDPARSISRPSAARAVREFIAGPQPLALLAGVSGVGKTTSILHLARTRRLHSTTAFIRAAQLDSESANLSVAIARALRLDKIEDLPRLDEVGLIVLDGFNELVTPKAPKLLIEEVTALTKQLHARGWKLLVTTRAEGLAAFSTVPSSLLYSPPEFVHDSKFPLPAHIRLGGYDWDEFDQARRAYDLPTSLPYADFRHPLLMRFAADFGSGFGAQRPWHELLGAFYARSVQRIASASGLHPGLVRSRIEALSSEPHATAGLIPFAVVLPSDVGLLAAAVDEAVIEQTPQGYRWVYDELFEFVRSSAVVGPMTEEFKVSTQSSIKVLDAFMREFSFGVTARALERVVMDDAPETAAFLERLAIELSDRSLGWERNRMELVLGRVFDHPAIARVKDALPIFDVDADRQSLFLVSEEHLHYAFSTPQLQRMVRSSARTDPDNDSYPFRLKDLNDVSAREHARELLWSQDAFAAVRVLIGIDADLTAFELLYPGLADEQRIGSEHTFSSFCNHVLLSFIDRFETRSLLQAVALGGHPVVFLAAARLDIGEAMNVLRSDELAQKPYRIAMCARALMDAYPEQTETLLRECLVRSDFPAAPLVGLLPPALDERERGKLREKAIREFLAGELEFSGLANFESMQILGLEELVGLTRKRLAERPQPIDTPDFALSVFEPMAMRSPPAIRSQLVERLLGDLVDIDGVDGFHQVLSAETLLRWVDGQELSDIFKASLANMAAQSSAHFAQQLRYYAFGWSATPTPGRHYVSHLMVATADIEVMTEVAGRAAKELPNSELTKALVCGMLKKHGEEALVHQLKILLERSRAFPNVFRSEYLDYVAVLVDCQSERAIELLGLIDD